jgi:phosphoribosyl-ATP pyrophosphohydrolase/phosphoribosyl-AMP cyclohydrolase
MDDQKVERFPDAIISKINFDKSGNGLAPAIIQDANTSIVLMLGFMNAESLARTITEKKVFFYSRSRNRLWKKGEESGNFLILKDILLDCDKDTILIKALPQGPVCHTGADTCFGESNESPDFIAELEMIIADRKSNPSSDSYTSKLLAKGINKVAQKLGEEAVELVIESKDNDKNLFLNEAADLLFHFMVLLAAKGYTFEEVTSILQKRHKKTRMESQ